MAGLVGALPVPQLTADGSAAVLPHEKIVPLRCSMPQEKSYREMRSDGPFLQWGSDRLSGNQRRQTPSGQLHRSPLLGLWLHRAQLSREAPVNRVWCDSYLRQRSDFG